MELLKTILDKIFKLVVVYPLLTVVIAFGTACIVIAILILAIIFIIVLPYYLLTWEDEDWSRIL